MYQTLDFNAADKRNAAHELNYSTYSLPRYKEAGPEVEGYNYPYTVPKFASYAPSVRQSELLARDDRAERAEPVHTQVFTPVQQRTIELVRDSGSSFPWWLIFAILFTPICLIILLILTIVLIFRRP